MTTPRTPDGTDLLRGSTLFRAGIALVVLSAGLLFGYSIEQGWIGPLARIVLAAVAGSGMVVGGTALAGHRPVYGRLLQGGGSAVLFVTVYAAHVAYAMTTTTEAFVQLTAVAGVTVALAIRERSEVLATLGLAAAASAPAVIDGRMALAGEVGHIVVVGAAATLLFVRMGWVRTQVVTGLAIGATAGLDVLGRGTVAGSVGSVHLQSAATVAWAMLVIVPLATAVARRSATSLVVVTSSGGSLAFYVATRLIWDDTVTSQWWWSLLALGLVGVHAVAGRVLARVGLTTAAVAQIVPVVALGLAAIAESLPAEWVLVGAAVTAIGLVLAGRDRSPSGLTDAGHLLYLATAIVFIGFVASGGPDRRAADLVPGVIVIASGAVIGFVIRGTSTDDLAPVYLGLSYGGTAAWMLAEFPRVGAEGLSLVTAGWAILGVGAIVSGRLGRSRTVLAVGFGTVGIALAKLLLIDLAAASPVTRIGLFAGVGVLLLGAGYWLGDDRPETPGRRVAAEEDAPPVGDGSQGDGGQTEAPAPRSS